MKWSVKLLSKSLIVIVVLIIAWIIDAELPNHIIVTSLYEVSIVLAAYWFSSRAVILVSLISLILFILESSTEHVLAINLILGASGIFIIAFLAMQLSAKRSKLEQNTKNLATAHQQLQSFMSMISHDLAQPITTLKLFTELAAKKYRKKNSTSLDQYIIDAITQIERLVGDLKDASSVGLGTFNLNLNTTDLVTLLQKVIIEQKLRTKKHKFKVHLSGRKCIGYWDENRLTQVFNNIISNAIKYSPKGGIIEVTMKRTETRVKTIISDQGLGMNRAQIKLLFQPFSRQHASESIEGTGLGLFISKAIIEKHQGKILVKSQEGKGTTFTIDMPFNSKQ